MSKIKVAIVGYGNIGKYTLHSLQTAPDMEIAGIVRRAGAENCPVELASYTVVKDITELGPVDVAILLAEEGDSAKLLSLLNRSIAVLIQCVVGTDHLVYHMLYLAELLISYLLEVREVETQGVLIYIRTLLLYVVAQNLL